MICSVAGCYQTVMPEIDKESPSVCHWYHGNADLPDQWSPHWGFQTYHKNNPLCYFHQKVKDHRIEGYDLQGEKSWVS